MSYIRSNARVAFENQVHSLKKTARASAARTRKIPHHARELVLHAAVFETSAALEMYVSDFFEGYEYEAKKHSIGIDKMPRALRTYLVVNNARPHFANYILNEDEKRALERLDAESKIYDAIRSDNRVGAEVKITKVLEKKKYPSPKNWIALFRRFGLNEVFKSLEKRMHRDAKALLQSFNDVRTELAHGYAPSVTCGDVIAHIENIEAIVRALDRVLFTHVCRHSGKSTWPSL